MASLNAVDRRRSFAKFLVGTYVYQIPCKLRRIPETQTGFLVTLHEQSANWCCKNTLTRASAR